MLFFDVGVQFASIAAAGDAALLHAPLPVKTTNMMMAPTIMPTSTKTTTILQGSRRMSGGTSEANEDSRHENWGCVLLPCFRHHDRLQESSGSNAQIWVV